MPDGNASEGQFERKEEESLRPWPEALFKFLKFPAYPPDCAILVGGFHREEPEGEEDGRQSEEECPLRGGRAFGARR